MGAKPRAKPVFPKRITVMVDAPTQGEEPCLLVIDCPEHAAESNREVPAAIYELREAGVVVSTPAFVPKRTPAGRRR